MSELQIPKQMVQKVVATDDMLKYFNIFTIMGDIEKNGTCIGKLADESELYEMDSDDERLEEAIKLLPKQNPSYDVLRKAVTNAYKSFDFAFEVNCRFGWSDNLQILGNNGELIDLGPVGKITDEIIRPYCNVAPYGDLQTMETKIDPKVRSGLEIDYERIKIKKGKCYSYRDEDNDEDKETDYQASVITSSLSQVQEQFQDDTLYLEPYKLNVYVKDGHFKPHKDTPRFPNMVGTLVVTLQEASKGGKLIIRHEEKSFEATEATAFFCDREHEVTPIEEGLRITLTFSICRDDGSVPKTAQAISFKRTTPVVKDYNIDALIKTIKDSPLQKIGILTEFDYTQKGISLKSLKGNDKIVYEQLSKEPLFKIELLPVIVKQHYVNNVVFAEFPYRYLNTGGVYRLLDKDLQRMLLKEEPNKEEEDKIIFFWKKTGLELFKSSQQGCEHVGNHALLEMADNIYFNGAIIVTDLSEKDIHDPDDDENISIQ